MEILGIDVGGTGIKGAPVDIETGTLLTERLRVLTPEPSKPRPVAEKVAEVARHFNWHGPIGCGFPAPIRGGVAGMAANIHKKWIGTNAATLFSDVTGCPVCVINDADAAGLAEMKFGAGKGRQGVVLIFTIGTGIGSAVFTDGHLVPNTEFGHIEFKGEEAEARASDAARKREDLSWEKWAHRFDGYLHYMNKLFSPDLIILGGGASKDYSRFMPYLTVPVELVIAQFLNEAGIVGAALAARSLLE